MAEEDCAHLAFVGPDESGMCGKLKKMAAQLGLEKRVHFSGPLTGELKWAAYRDAQLFVLPSQNENFGNTAAEAVAAGTPVIVTKKCGIAPLLDGVAGVTVEHDASAVARALTGVLRNPARYQELKEGCVTAMQRLDWGQPTRYMDGLYRRLVGPARS